jgi:hypothetical protein
MESHVGTGESRTNFAAADRRGNQKRSFIFDRLPISRSPQKHPQNLYFQLHLPSQFHLTNPTIVRNRQKPRFPEDIAKDLFQIYSVASKGKLHPEQMKGENVIRFIGIFVSNHSRVAEAMRLLDKAIFALGLRMG